MLFIHGKQEEGHHNQHHTHRCGAVSNRLTEQKEQWYTSKCSTAEADQLPFCQVEHDLCFHMGQVLGDRYISQGNCLLPG